MLCLFRGMGQRACLSSHADAPRGATGQSWTPASLWSCGLGSQVQTRGERPSSATLSAGTPAKYFPIQPQGGNHSDSATRRSAVQQPDAPAGCTR